MINPKIYFSILISLLLFSCSSSDESIPVTPEDITITPPNNFPYVFAEKPSKGKDIYIPVELQNSNFESNNNRWSYQRSASSDNLIIFWEKGFGQYPSKTSNTALRFNVKEILDLLEHFYAYYRDTMKFIDAGSSKSDNYRMIVMINYQEEWLATGAGYDDVIGATWMNPEATKHPAILAHELGHTFQYQVHCDGNYGFRDQNYVGSFWEQCSQFMSWQLYPDTYVSDLPFFLTHVNKHFSHENYRYQSFVLMEYWKEKHGIEILGKVWKEAVKPDHPLQSYMRVTDISQDDFNNEFYEYACKNIIWDYPVGNNIRNTINQLSPAQRQTYKHTTKLDIVEDGWYQISNEQILYSYGYNAIPLNLPATGTVVEVSFEGLLENQFKDNAGWRWGFATVKNDGTICYDNMQSLDTGSTSVTVSDTIKELWLVVTGAPKTHTNHVWDEDNSNDEVFPYKVKFTNTNPI